MKRKILYIALPCLALLTVFLPLLASEDTNYVGASGNIYYTSKATKSSEENLMGGPDFDGPVDGGSPLDINGVTTWVRSEPEGTHVIAVNNNTGKAVYIHPNGFSEIICPVPDLSNIDLTGITSLINRIFK